MFMDALLSLDTSLFLFINHLPHFFFADLMAMFLSGIGKWGAVWFVFVILLFLREEKRHHLFFLPFILSGGISVFLSEFLVKWIVARPRPFIEMGAIILENPTNYSFPSTHATLAWAMAVVLASHEVRFRFLFYVLAICISLSRVYLGVHYPIDVIAGGIVGCLIGNVVLYLEKYISGSRLRIPKTNKVR